MQFKRFLASAQAIRAIIGGPTAEGSSNAKRKSYARSVQTTNLPRKSPKTTEPITFIEIDLEGV